MVRLKVLHKLSTLYDIRKTLLQNKLLNIFKLLFAGSVKGSKFEPLNETLKRTMNTLKANQIQKDGITWELRKEGSDIILDSVATDTMRVIPYGWEMLLKQIGDNLPYHQLFKTSLQRLEEMAEEDMQEFAEDMFDRSIVVIP